MGGSALALEVRGSGRQAQGEIGWAIVSGDIRGSGQEGRGGRYREVRGQGRERVRVSVQGPRFA